jgi:hypothetical protein
MNMKFIFTTLITNPINTTTQKHEMLWNWIRVGSLWKKKSILHMLWLPWTLSQSYGLDLSTLPSFRFQNNLLTSIHAFSWWVTWNLFLWIVGNLQISFAFCNFFL